MSPANELGAGFRPDGRRHNCKGLGSKLQGKRVVCEAIFLISVGPIVPCENFETNPIHRLVRAPGGYGEGKRFLHASRMKSVCATWRHRAVSYRLIRSIGRLRRLHNDLAVRRVGPEHTTATIGSSLDGKRKTLTKDQVCYASAGVA